MTWFADRRRAEQVAWRFICKDRWGEHVTHRPGAVGHKTGAKQAANPAVLAPLLTAVLGMVVTA
jgi:hypothetical protein